MPDREVGPLIGLHQSKGRAGRFGSSAQEGLDQTACKGGLSGAEIAVECNDIASTRGCAKLRAESGGGGIVRKVECEHAVRHSRMFVRPNGADMRHSTKQWRASTDSRTSRPSL